MPTVFNLARGLFVCASWILAGSSFANAKEWAPLTSLAHPNCSTESPCTFFEGTQKFELSFTVIQKRGRQILAGISIRKSGSGTPQTFQPQEMNSISRTGFFEIYLVKLRSAEFLDIAIHAYDSPTEGPSYNYLAYNLRQQTFAASLGTFPKLAYDPAKKIFVSDIQSTKYMPEQVFSPESR